VKALWWAAGLVLCLNTAHAADRGPLSIQAALESASARTASSRDLQDVFSSCCRPHFADVPWPVLSLEQRAHLLVVVPYLEAALADLQEAALNESIAMAYVRSERATATAADPATTLALDVTYRDLLLQRGRVRVVQQQTRSLLAVAMGRAAEVPGELQDVDDPGVLKTAVAMPGNAPPESPRLLHARRVAVALAQQAETAELTAAKAHLALAEARQEKERETFAKGQVSGLELGDAMVAVAHAQLELRIAQYRAAVYRSIASSLGAASPKTP